MLASSSFDLIVLGGGPAGVTAALRGRELGASVCLIESRRLGGVCTNTGCVPVRALARAARLVRDGELHGEFGLEGTAPRVDFAAVMRNARRTVEAVHEKKSLRETLDAAGVQVVEGQGRARFVSPNEVEVGTARYAGKSLVIAVGGHARRPPVPGAELMLLPEELWSLNELPRRLVVIGSGATGLQVASVFGAFGSEVTLLEIAPRLMPGSDEAVSNEMTAALKHRGIRVLTGIKGVTKVERTAVPTDADPDPAEAAYLRVHVDSGGEVTTLDTDVVFAAVGWPANLEGLNLDAAGVKAEKSAIVVDDYQRTSAAHIYVAGDADGKKMLVQTGFYEALLAAENAVLGPKTTCARMIVPAGGFTDPKYGAVGLTEARARELHCSQGEDNVVTGEARYDELDRALIDRRRTGLCKLIVHRQTRQLLGAHVVGENATEVVQVAAAAMTGDTAIEQLASLQFSYPTYCAIVGIAARRVARMLGQVVLSRPWAEMATDRAARPPEWERNQTR